MVAVRSFIRLHDPDIARVWIVVQAQMLPCCLPWCIATMKQTQLDYGGSEGVRVRVRVRLRVRLIVCVSVCVCMRM